MKLDYTTLQNGLKYFFYPIRTEISVILILFNVGSKDEESEHAGISHFLEHTLFLGSKNYKTNDIIYENVDKLGAFINGFTFNDKTGYYIKVKTSYLHAAIKLLADLIINPLFPEKQIEKERNVVLEELNSNLSKPQRLVQDNFEENIFQGTIWSKSVGGTEKTLKNISVNEIKNYYKKFYCPENALLVLVSASSPIELINEYFGKWNQKCDYKFDRPLKSISLPTKPKKIFVEKDTSQDFIIIGFPIDNIELKDRITFDVLNIILGGMLSSRLFTELRHNSRLVYNVKSTVQFFKTCGYLFIKTSANTTEIPIIIQKIFIELDKMKIELVLPTELQKVKTFVRGAMELRNENILNIALYYSNGILNNSFISINDYLENIDKVTAEDILQIAGKYLNQNQCTVSIVGKNNPEI